MPKPKNPNHLDMSEVLPKPSFFSFLRDPIYVTITMSIALLYFACRG